MPVTGKFAVLKDTYGKDILTLPWAAPAVLSAFLIVLSFQNFLLFHTLAELFAIIIGILLFVIAWQTYQFSRNHFLLFLACGFFWLGALDLLHTLVYFGMNILPIDDPNRSAQLWVVARYSQALVLLAAPLFLTRKVARGPLFIAFGGGATVLGALVMSGNFPDAFIVGTGLTPFKVYSEYVIIALLLGALVHLAARRALLPVRVFTLLALSIALTIGAELAFTLYVSVYGISNMVGHIFKLVAFWLIYMAIIRTTLHEPYLLLQQELALRKKTETSLKMISLCNEVLVRSTSERELLTQVCDIIVNIGSYRFVWIGFCEADEAKSVSPQAHGGEEIGYLDDISVTWADTEAGHGPTGTAIRSGKPVIVQHIDQNTTFEPWLTDSLKYGFCSSACLPLLFEGVAFGVLNIYASNPDAFDEAETNLLVQLADDLSYGIQALRTRENRARVRESLRDSEDRYRDLYESAPIGYATISAADATILRANRTLQEMLGYEFAELSKMEVFDLYGEGADDKISGYGIFKRSFEGALIQAEPVLMVRKDGTTFWGEVSISPVLDDNGKVIKSHAVVVDITEHQEAEQQRMQIQRLDSLGSLASGVAHDINNMLLPILNLTPMVARKHPEGSSERKKLDMVLKAAQRMRDMAARILAFGREGDGEMAEIDIFTAYNAAVDLLRLTLPTTITIRDDLDPHVGKVKADPKQIEAMLMNLASNARDAMNGKTGILAVSLSPVAVGHKLAQEIVGLKVGRYAKTVFADTGRGMNKMTLQRIYDPFFTTKEKGKGTGLGLAMVFGTVAKYGGAITVSSEVGKGTTFEIYLPLVTAGLGSRAGGV